MEARLTRWEGLIDPFLVETVQTLASICPYRPPVGLNPIFGVQALEHQKAQAGSRTGSGSVN